MNFKILKPTYLPNSYSLTVGYRLSEDKYVTSTYLPDSYYIQKNHLNESTLPSGVYIIKQSDIQENIKAIDYKAYLAQTSEEISLPFATNGKGVYIESKSPNNNTIKDLFFQKQNTYIRIQGTTPTTKEEIIKIAEGLE